MNKSYTGAAPKSSYLLKETQPLPGINEIPTTIDPVDQRKDKSYINRIFGAAKEEYRSASEITKKKVKKLDEVPEVGEGENETNRASPNANAQGEGRVRWEWDQN